jgi:hypothetical protein
VAGDDSLVFGILDVFLALDGDEVVGSAMRTVSTAIVFLGEFVWDWDGSKMSSSTYLSANDFAAFSIFIVKGGYNDKSALPEGVDCNPLIKIDNIRVVPNK